MLPLMAPDADRFSALSRAVCLQLLFAPRDTSVASRVFIVF